MTGMKKKTGFTLIELLVVVSIIALLVSILLPALAKARENGKAAVCKSQLKQLGLAFNFYAEQYNGYCVWQPGDGGGTRSQPWTWESNLVYSGFLNDYKILECPSGPSGKGQENDISSYRANWGCIYTPKPAKLTRKGVSERFLVVDGKCGNSHNLWNDPFWNVLTYRNTPNTVILGSNNETFNTLLTSRHNGLMNVLFNDTHVTNVRASEINANNF